MARGTPRWNAADTPSKLLPLATAVTIAAALMAVLYELYGVPGSHPKADEIPASPAPTNWEVLDEACGVKVRQDFVSENEIVYLLELLERTGGWAPSPTGGRNFEVPAALNTRRFAQTLEDDPVVLRIERRIAESTGIEIHPDEDMLSLARITSRGTAPRGGHFAAFGLHHDSDTKPNRARTVIVYLSAPESGGATVFPLCGDSGDDPETASDFGQALGGLWGGKDQSYSRHAGGSIIFCVNCLFPLEGSHTREAAPMCDAAIILTKRSVYCFGMLNGRVVALKIFFFQYPSNFTGR